MARLIKKYKNRRLYDTELSRYITVEELHNYVLEGKTFRVEEASSHEDLTQATLLQILVEIESGASKFFSEDALKQLIILANHPLSKSFRNLIEQLLAMVDTAIPEKSYLHEYQDIANNWQKNAENLYKDWEKLFKAKE